MQRRPVAPTDLAGSLWGLAEATLFFIVPDVLLSAVALTSVRRALRVALWTLAGALVGGALMWALGRTAPASGTTLLTQLPGIDTAMIAEVDRQLRASGLAALFIGPATGVPYKVYALQAGQAGIGLTAFLLVSVPARLLRFVLVSLAVAGVGRLLRRWLGLRLQRVILAVSWAAFYAAYFYAMSG